jgi:hypothetical protein
MVWDVLEQIYVLEKRMDNLHYWIEKYENVHWTSALSESSSSDSSDSSKESNDFVNIYKECKSFSKKMVQQ